MILKIISRTCLFVFFIGICFGHLNLNAQNRLSADRWQEDLQYAVKQIRERHFRPYHSVRKERFDAAVQELQKNIPSLRDYEVALEIKRIVALIGDLHTNIKFEPTLWLPIEFYYFKDGPHIIAADKKYSELVGARIIGIENKSIEESYEAVKSVISHENEMGLKNSAPRFLVLPEVLKFLEIANGLQEIALKIEKNGKKSSVQIKSVRKQPNRKKMIQLNDGAKNPVPLWLKDPNNKYWFTYLADSKTLYVQFNSVSNKRKKIASFFREVFAFVEKNDVDRFVLDLRNNGGGNDPLFRKIIPGFVSMKLNKPGKFFTIIGRYTVSAGQHLVNDLEYITKTLFVGEPPRQRVNFFSDGRGGKLPNSGMRMRVATGWLQSYIPLPYDPRQWTTPDIPVELTSEDYRLNRDPVLKAIFDFDPANKISKKAIKRLRDQ